VSERQRQNSGRAQQQDRLLSSTFLALVAAFLACAVWMLYQPDHARLLVFPFVTIGWVISLCLHEFGHAIVAYYCGDTTVRDKGYLTLNPLRYTDPFYSILFPLLILTVGGIGLPGGAVYIDWHYIRRRIHFALVSAAGPLATAVVLAILLVTIDISAQVAKTVPELYAALAFLALLELTALLFNLIPCPGLDGWGIVEPFLPDQMRRWGRQMAGLGPLILFGAFFLVPGVNRQFWILVYSVCDLIGLDPRPAFLGYKMFQFWR
jgi:Zn-dependent protease